MLSPRLLILTLPLSLLACEGDQGAPTGQEDVLVDQGDESDDTGVMDDEDEDTGEAEDTGDWEDLDASEVSVVFVQNELIGTIFTLEWTAEQPLRVAGRASLANGRGFNTPFASELATSGTVELRGLPALTDFQAELLFENEAGERGKTAAESLRTGGPPSSLPVISTIVGDSQETVVPGWHLTTVLTDAASTGKEPALLILN